MNPEQFIDLLEKLIEKKLQTKMYHLGTIHQVEGDRASVYIDGSSTPTPNVPYNPNIKFNAGEDVWVVYINFDPKDKFILCKRGTEEPDPPSSGEDMQMHGNEWHTIAFETASGAQNKVDTHANKKYTHGDNYIAQTTNPDQWPLWTEIENKPSEFPPESHDHNLADLAEKSYNSLTDKPAIPSNPEDIGAEPAFDKKTAFNKDFGTTAGTVTQGNDSRLSDARTPLPHDHDDSYYTKVEVDSELDTKVDKVTGKGLSTEDYTTTEKNKLAGIEAGANKYTHPSTHPASMIIESTTKKFVSDTEKANWDNKAEISDIPTKVGQLQNDKNYVTQSELGEAGLGDMLKSIYDINDNGIVDNAEKVNGFTVGVNVPANAKFTDTVYTHPANHPASMITESSTKRFVSDAEKTAWNNPIHIGTSPPSTGNLWIDTN